MLEHGLAVYHVVSWILYVTLVLKRQLTPESNIEYTCRCLTNLSDRVTETHLPLIHMSRFFRSGFVGPRVARHVGSL